MNRLLGPVRQIAYVVADLDRAIGTWSEKCGVGPWFVQRSVQLKRNLYCGELVPDFRFSIALASSGDIQVELLQQHCNSPSVFREAQLSRGGGAHHWAVWPDDYDAAYRIIGGKGLQVMQEGESEGGRFSYHQLPEHAGGFIEVVELTPNRQKLNEKIHRASIGWNGSDCFVQ